MLPREGTRRQISTCNIMRSLHTHARTQILVPSADTWHPCSHGQSLVHLDPAAERRVRLKIDFCIIPTVSLLYLFCFIDRANIGPTHLSP